MVTPETIGEATRQALEARFTREICRDIWFAGVSHIVFVENIYGRWLALHAEDVEQAQNIARSWVDDLKCRGASVREISMTGLGSRVVFSHYEGS